MSYLAVLNLGKGDWQHGLPTVIAQLWDEDSPNPMQFTGSLPAAPELEALYGRWQTLYEALYATQGWRRSSARSPAFEVDEADLTHISHTEFHQLCQDLRAAINRWLNEESFRPIDRQLRTQLRPSDPIRVIIVAEDAKLLRLPWCLWSFLDDYPQAEVAFSLPEYFRTAKATVAKPRRQVRILAILGNHAGIDVATDQQILQQLPNAELKFLLEPKAGELNQQLWKPGWDVLFFAGHSSSGEIGSRAQGTGRIYLNATESLTIAQLKFALRQAIAQGLKLAIFNSCDGLGLARDLADLNLPQVIVMREPVPDRVAQEFLKHFLGAFAGGASLYSAVREAREKLQALETDFPCANWLPVICQNPAEVPPTWEDWCGVRSFSLRLPTRRELQTLLCSSLVVTGLIAGVRWLGWLQPLELWSFDRSMQARPAEPPDPRLLAVTITEQDIQAEGRKLRRGSISDRTLNGLLKKLEPHQPVAIGLDLYRDAAADVPELATRLRQTNHLFAVCKRPAGKSDPIGVLPPPEIPEDRLGFSDFIRDGDGVVRRHLLMLPSNPSSRCTAAYAFSVQLANRYLEAHGVAATLTAQNDLQFGNTVFRQLKRRTGGYQSLVANSGQVLLNYRAASSPRDVVQQATLEQVLTNQINPNAIAGRIVLIGIAAPHSSGDYWTTPFGRADIDRIPGVLIHAQMVSQMLSAVLDQRPLLWVWSTWIETLWIAGWSALGGLLAWHRRLEFLILTVAVAIATLIGLCQIVLIRGGWIPLAPPAIALVLTGTSVALLTATSDQPKIHA